MSEEKEPIESLLQKSHSFRSLGTERFVYDTLNKQDWQVVHGAFYEDADTGKLREIDVAARQHWQRPPQLGSISAWLHCFVECKTLDGYHIIVTPAPRGIEASKHLSSWWTSGNYPFLSQLSECLRSKGLSEVQLHQLMENIEKIAFPGGNYCVTRDVLVNPPPASLLASSFRETNVKAEKELDASVLWKAGLILGSVIRAHHENYFKAFLEDMESGPEFARNNGTDPVREILGIFQSRVTMAHVYHPIVVLECSLWKATRSNVIPINTFRFVQLDSYGTVDLWFDVVTREYFPTFISELTAHYKRTYRKAGTRRSRKYA